MKSALIFISSIFLIGVFGESVSVSVMEGNSLTLHTSLTEIQRADTVEWRLNGDRIAKISRDSSGLLSVPVSPDGASGGRLQLDKQTGDLKITNFRNTDSGSYTLKIKSIKGSSDKIFNVSGVLNADRDPVKSVPVTVGESVTLKTQKQSDEVMKWRFGSQKTVIAEFKVRADSFTVYGDVLDGRFRDRLKLDDDTGSLNITDTTTEHEGDYEAEIRGSGYTKLKTFNVNVTDVKSLSVEEGGSVPLHTGLTQIQKNVILWRFGDKDNIIASLKGPDVYKSWSNVYLNEQTGDLNISNIRRDQFGDYKVEIKTTNMISHRKYHITISDTETVKLVLMEGDSVTLHTGPSKIQRNNAILWYGHNDTLITRSVDARWKNTVQNDQTGDLTIRNIRRDQSGDYEIVFTNIRMLLMSIHRKFHINIADVFSDETDGMKTVSVMKGDSVFLKTSVTEIQKGDLIEWLFGAQNITIAKTDGKSNSTYNDKDVRFKDRLNLDIQTGGLTIENSNIEHSGRYQLKIINNNKYTIQKSFSVTVTVPDPSLSPGAVAGIVAVVLLVFLASAAGAISYRHKRSKLLRPREVNGQNDTSIKDEETELTKPAEAVEQR